LSERINQKGGEIFLEKKYVTIARSFPGLISQRGGKRNRGGGRGRPGYGGKHQSKGLEEKDEWVIG